MAESKLPHDIQIYWTLFFKEKFNGFEDFSFFVYCHHTRWQQALKNVEECINEHLKNGVEIAKIKLDAKNCHPSESENFSELMNPKNWEDVDEI